MTITKKELVGYFTSPIAYIFIIIFLLLSSFLTFASPPFGNFLNSNYAGLSDAFFSFHPWLFLILIPPISMRMWAEEKRNGTIELMFTLPVNIFSLVIGKFIAGLIILCIAVILTFPMVITVNYLGAPDNNVIILSYAGTILLGAGFLAIGSFSSSVVKNQISAYIISFAILLFLILAGHQSIINLFSDWAPLWLVNTISNIGIFTYFNNLRDGILNVTSIAYFISLIIIGIFATCVSLNCSKI